MTREECNSYSKIILNSSLMVHKEMGPGLLESVYEACLIKEFRLQGIKTENQVPIPLTYKGFELAKDFFVDILVENEIILEIKSVEMLLTVHQAQIISYLKLTNKKLGFLINFNVLC